LQLLGIAEIVVIRHVVNDEDALVYKVFDFLFALADASSGSINVPPAD
jgi:hypothetical protein